MYEIIFPESCAKREAINTCFIHERLKVKSAQSSRVYSEKQIKNLCLPRTCITLLSTRSLTESSTNV